jgi:hypothetical protein
MQIDSGAGAFTGYQNVNANNMDDFMNENER